MQNHLILALSDSNYKKRRQQSLFRICAETLTSKGYMNGLEEILAEKGSNSYCCNKKKVGGREGTMQASKRTTTKR